MSTIWYESSSGFGEESPILFKPTKKFEYFESSAATNPYLEDLYRRLLNYLKKTIEIPRDELRSHLEKVSKMNPSDFKSKWLIMKTKGLLQFILKKRSAFQTSIVKGEITIYEKTLSQEIATDFHQDFPEPSLPREQINGYTPLNIPSDLLSNNNFLSINETKCFNKIETESNYNYSQDMFASETVESLHNFAQENYQILKSFTQATDNDDEIFKVPPPISDKVEKLCKVHDNLEESLNSLISTQSLPGVREEIFQNDNLDRNNIFDNLTISNEELKDDFTKELEELKSWMMEITYNLTNLQINDTHVSVENMESAQDLNDSVCSTGSTRVKTYFSEQNFKILREACSKFKRNLEEEKKLEPLLDLLTNCQEN